MSYEYYDCGWDRYEPNRPQPSESASVFSYESSDEEGHFSYSDLSPKYDEDSFDLELGFKKLKIKDDKDSLPVQFNKNGPIRPTFPFDTFSNLRKIDPEYFGNIQLAPDTNTLYLSFFRYGSNCAEISRYINSRVSIHKKKHTQRLAIDLAGPSEHLDYTNKLTKNQNLTRQDFRSLIELFTKSFPSTRSLYLNFRPSITRSRTDQDLIWLGFYITKHMPNLKHFALQFDKNEVITSEGVKQFCKQIVKYSKRLECLSLDFSRCKVLQGCCLKSLTKHITTCLCHLKVLRLHIPIASEDDMKYLSFNKTRYLKQLEGLDLCINQDEKTNMLGKFQKDFRRLSFYLNIDSSRFQINFAQLSSSYLQPIENLRFLNINLPTSKVSQEEAQKFVETVNTKIKTLDHLKINFVACVGVMQAFLASLKCTENSNQLKKLKLGFNFADEPSLDSSLNSEKSEDSAIQGLNVELFPTFTANFLQHLKDLTYLDLNLQTVPLQDLQVKNLATCIAKDLLKLEFLNIFFFLCSQMTDESVKVFQEDFCAENTLINLKTLILSFSNCYQITKKAIKSLRSSIKKRTPTIESATVNFLDYQGDPNYCSSDDEDNETARYMAGGSQWKAIKIDPEADPDDEKNWRIIDRVDFEDRESSVFESDGEDPEDPKDEEM